MGYRNRVLGKQGEDIAARFLARKGYKIIARNVRTFVGELDIVARKKYFIVFVEVKTRKSKSFGPPYLSITGKKKKKLIHCALCYLKMKNMLNMRWRVDVVSIELDEFSGFAQKIEHFKNAIEK
ncbi:MAG: YraN family protein [Candidatus Omnitrophota bacterium]|nr:MAG: YraN family protein [Candidatus Omnitrophota bacterium]